MKDLIDIFLRMTLNIDISSFSLAVNQALKQDVLNKWLNYEWSVSLNNNGEQSQL